MKLLKTITTSKHILLILLLALSDFRSLGFPPYPFYEENKHNIRYIREIKPLNIAPKDTKDKQSAPHFTSGTGFFVSSHHIITNEHVVRECSHIRVRGAVRPGYAKLRAIDKHNDLALLVTNRTPKHIAPLRGDNPLSEGEKVIVMGYPLEHGVKGDYLLREAVITDLNDTYEGVERIQFTDTVAKGNSGGPLLDTQGSVVGVVVGKMSFYLANAPYQDLADEPVKTSSVAVSLDSLKHFLDEHHIFYQSGNASNGYDKSQLESKAKEYVVNVHCVNKQPQH